MKYNPIGVFDSGYGGLTILKEIINQIPQYDFLYLGDNARAPYGNKSFNTVYKYTLQSVEWLFKQNCSLIILACNTASAKALRSIQQNDLFKFGKDKKVLGVIRPTTEIIGTYSKSGEIGILGTNGTVQSNSYPIEISKFFPTIKVYQSACPTWVSLVENNKGDSIEADNIINKDIFNLLIQAKDIDTILLACTHYPLLINTIKKFVPENISIISQGEIVANSLIKYLARHPEVENKCSKNGTVLFNTTGSSQNFDNKAATFFDNPVKSTSVTLY